LTSVSDTAKWLAVIAMRLARLKILTLLVRLTPGFGRD